MPANGEAMMPRLAVSMLRDEVIPFFNLLQYASSSSPTINHFASVCAAGNKQRNWAFLLDLLAVSRGTVASSHANISATFQFGFFPTSDDQQQHGQWQRRQ